MLNHVYEDNIDSKKKLLFVKLKKNCNHDQNFTKAQKAYSRFKLKNRDSKCDFQNSISKLTNQIIHMN